MRMIGGSMAGPSSIALSANHLLSILPQDELAVLELELEHVPLAFGLVLQEWEQPISHLWFPCRGVASILSRMADGASVEVATVGREGVVGLSAVLGVRRLANSVFVQIPGDGFRLSVERYVELQDRLPTFRKVLLRYAAALVTQIAQGSACNRLHEIEARCARWLLMTHDRVDGDSFLLTHEFLAQMLGVTRPSVTIAAGILQRAGLITYARGEVSILDRKRLEQASCECYAIITEEFRQLLQPDQVA
jgi:CRP-like cAMP-binding protein